MAIDKEIKKKITEEWLKAFPELSAFAQNKLYKVVGCCVFGIELIKLPHCEEYRPYFVIYGLWQNDVKKCLDAPILMQQLYNNKGLQFNIPYEKHSVYFDNVLESFRKQIVVSLNGNVTLKSLFQFVSNQFNDMLIRNNSALQAKLFELKFYVALYAGSEKQMQDIVNEIEKISRDWNMQMFEMWFGKYDLWIQKLQEKVDNREEFLRNIENNKKDKKIINLQNSKFVMDSGNH